MLDFNYKYLSMIIAFLKIVLFAYNHLFAHTWIQVNILNIIIVCNNNTNDLHKVIWFQVFQTII